MSISQPTYNQYIQNDNIFESAEAPTTLAINSEDEKKIREQFIVRMKVIGGCGSFVALSTAIAGPIGTAVSMPVAAIIGFIAAVLYLSLIALFLTGVSTSIINTYFESESSKSIEKLLLYLLDPKIPLSMKVVEKLCFDVDDKTKLNDKGQNIKECYQKHQFIKMNFGLNEKTLIPEVYFIPMFYYHSDRNKMNIYFKKNFFESLDNKILGFMNRKLIKKIETIFTNPDDSDIKKCFKLLETTNKLIMSGDQEKTNQFLSETKYNIISVEMKNINIDAEINSLESQPIDIFDILCSQKLFDLLLTYGKSNTEQYKLMENKKEKKLLHYLFEMCDDIGNASIGAFAVGTVDKVNNVTQSCVDNLKIIYNNDWDQYVLECKVEQIKNSICEKYTNWFGTERCPLTTTLYEYITNSD